MTLALIQLVHGPGADDDGYRRGAEFRRARAELEADPFYPPVRRTLIERWGPDLAVAARKCHDWICDEERRRHPDWTFEGEKEKAVCHKGRVWSCKAGVMNWPLKDIAELLGVYEDAACPADTRTRVEKIIAYLIDHEHESPTWETIAHDNGISRSTLARLANQHRPIKSLLAHAGRPRGRPRSGHVNSDPDAGRRTVDGQVEAPPGEG